MNKQNASRVELLLGQMTLEEKVAQLGCINVDDLYCDRESGWRTGEIDESKLAKLVPHGIGHIARAGTNRLYAPEKIAEICNRIQRHCAGNTRMGIPALVHEECLFGYWSRDGVSFPQAIGLASMWNPALLKRVGRVIGQQLRAAGGHQGLAPVLDVTRDQRWGRNEETYGEDPYLVAQCGIAYIRGLQGDDQRTGVMATIKHIVGHGTPEGGRNWAESHVGPRELREVHMFPVEAAVRSAGALSIMSAYHDIDGVPCSGSKELLQDILRDEWGFEGLVVSDYNSVRLMQELHAVAADFQEAGVMALKAGLDVELCDIVCYGELLVKAVRGGLVEEDLVDRSVRRVLQCKFDLGLFEQAQVDPQETITAFDHAVSKPLNLQAARESIVLLKNEGNTLPLSPSVQRIAVVGPNANTLENMYGNYSITVHFPPETPGVTTVGSVLEAIRSIASPQTDIRFVKGCELTEGETKGTILANAGRTDLTDGPSDSKGGITGDFVEAVEAAKWADAIIAVVGEQSGWRPHSTTGEGFDRSELTLPGRQELLIQSLYATGKPVVAVLINGHVVASPALVENCASIIEAWLPGECGGQAIADVLFGIYTPGGKLPVTVPKHVGQVPLYSRRKPSSAEMPYVDLNSKPLFAFGHGLSYTTFTYEDLEVTPDSVEQDGTVTVRCRITNTGNRTGDEVVQVYLRDEVASVTRPIKDLQAFHRLRLAPGQSHRVTFQIPVECVAFYDRQLRRVIEPGVIQVMVGSSSEDIRLREKFVIAGFQTVPVTRTRYSHEVQID